MSAAGGGGTATRRIVVRGRVQGVGFRWSTLAAANRLGVVGWARNLPDGGVEVHAQGDPSAVASLVEWLRQGPAAAEVSSLTLEAAAAEEGLDAFSIRG